MKRLIFENVLTRLASIAIFMVVVVAMLRGQTSVTTDILPLKGRPALVQASYTPVGTVSLAPVALPAGYKVVCANNVCSVQPPPIFDTAPTQAAWITLSQSSADPLTWCVTDQPLQNTYIPSMLHVSITLTVTTVPGVGQYPREAFQDIQPGPQLSPSGTSTVLIPPQWFKTACGGSPGVVFPSTTLNAGEQITAVQARVVF